ncbi:sensor histidine kinase [Acuticoccus sp. MNP-M23]|uniref:sensor histidine kinase n=1 Tax=Acuticoccus sp. MNP-M23 TaxID=3072793 RepID=UPI00281590DF|nr:sensor histidine kinase [Acuticoccus sp. MNP-M23]WMS43106.1 sensor histidine kinase [Acuticoccus sp. MNP-M23]
MTQKSLHFDVSTGLKRVLGQELITDDEVAIFELVKNSFDAGATEVKILFDEDLIVVADNGSGMSYDDLINRWLFVAYSAKRDASEDDFRDRIANRTHYAGSKGIGRFSTDRLGEDIVLQTKLKGREERIHRLEINWALFDQNIKAKFESIPVMYEERNEFEVLNHLKSFKESLVSGTIIEIKNLRFEWNRDEIKNLKSSLAKLINPFGSDVDEFSIDIIAPHEEDRDHEARLRAKSKGVPLSSRDIINGKVGNFIFSDLQEKTTFLIVEIIDDKIESALTDRGELIYKIREPNPYPDLEGSGFRCEMYYLNHSAKLTFARRVGLPSVQFGSVFLFRNGFRVYPVGEDGDDWFGFARRKQQGHSRYLGTREVIGRIDVYGDNEDFQESSSRNQGLIDTPAVRQLQKCVMDHCLRRLEKYVVPVSWVDKAEAETNDLSRLLTDPGRARVSAAVAALVDNDDVELIDFSRRLVGLLNERSSQFESSLVDLRTIAGKVGDREFLKGIDQAEKRFEELRTSESEARKVADRQREIALRATERAAVAEAAVEVERRRSHFLEAAVNLDTATIVNLHHQVTIYSVDINQQIENLITDTQGQETVPREALLQALEQIAFLNRKVQAVARFATKANFQLDSEKIEADLASFIEEYIDGIARGAGGARLRVVVENDHPEFRKRFNPIDVSIVVDNLVSNARRAKASEIRFTLRQSASKGLLINVSDNGRGFAKGVDRGRIFEMGYTTTHGSGLGLYHVRQVLGQMGGSIDVVNEHPMSGVGFSIIIAKSGNKK